MADLNDEMLSTSGPVLPGCICTGAVLLVKSVVRGSADSMLCFVGSSHVMNG